MAEYVVVASKLGVTVRDDLFGRDLQHCQENQMSGIILVCHDGKMHVEFYDAVTKQRHPLVCPTVKAWDNEAGLDNF